MNKLLGLLALAGLVVITGSSSASTFAPGKPMTVQMRGVPCSMTTSAPVFVSGQGGWVMRYSGSISCAGGKGQKTLEICAQVQNGSRWFTISGSCLFQGPTPFNPLRLHTARTVFLGHVYRISASGRVQYPDFSGTRSTVAVHSRGFAP